MSNVQIILSEQVHDLMTSVYRARNQALLEEDYDTANTLQQVHDGLLFGYTSLQNGAAEAIEAESAPSSVSEALSEAIAFSDYSITALAETAGVAHGTITNILQGVSTPRRSTLAKLEAALGLNEGSLDVE